MSNFERLVKQKIEAGEAAAEAERIRLENEKAAARDSLNSAYIQIETEMKQSPQYQALASLFADPKLHEAVNWIRNQFDNRLENRQPEYRLPTINKAVFELEKPKDFSEREQLISELMEGVIGFDAGVYTYQTTRETAYSDCDKVTEITSAYSSWTRIRISDDGGVLISNKKSYKAAEKAVPHRQEYVGGRLASTRSEATYNAEEQKLFDSLAWVNVGGVEGVIDTLATEYAEYMVMRGLGRATA